MEETILGKFDRTSIIVDLDIIRSNLCKLKENVSGKNIMAVVKMDGYGHGAYSIAKYTSDIACGYALATAEEALGLRDNGIDSMLLILGVVPKAYYAELIEAEIRMTVFTMSQLEAVNAVAVSLGKKAFIHVKIDTGMTRIGIRDRKEAVDFIKYAIGLSGIEVEGIFTHFAKADNVDKTYAHAQYTAFHELLSELDKEGIDIPIKHCANSAAIIDLPEYSLSMVRAGIALYGLAPSADVDISGLGLCPALTWKSHVAFIKTVEKGCPISYDGIFVTDRDMVVATIPVGYGDGYPRALSNKASVLIKGQRARILGRICMDQLMVDITDIEGVKECEEVVLVGAQGKDMITMEELAALTTETFNYEIICNINKRVPRLYYLNNELVYVDEQLRCHK
ncbi:MAG: alanine racemase [Lachnospiraceae bacterium]|nr:alanine racemase [Lachnospiraceae bacterium]